MTFGRFRSASRLTVSGGTHGSGNKVAIVTGASRGIGRAIAQRLGQAGAKVVVNYNRNSAPAEALAEEIGGVAVQAMSARRLVPGPHRGRSILNSVDILVNNAGIPRWLDGEMSDEDWSDVMDTNLNSTFRLCRAATEIMMRRRSGNIINVWVCRYARERGSSELCGE